MDQLKIRALLALYELAQNADAEPYPKSRALRFVLAFLFSRSPGDRTAFDHFWRMATQQRGVNMPDSVARSTRSQHMLALLKGICEAVGESPRLIEDYHRAELAAQPRAAERHRTGEGTS